MAQTSAPAEERAGSHRFAAILLERYALLSNQDSPTTTTTRPVGALRRLDPGLCLAALLALFVVLPLLQPGLPGTADAPIHFYRTLEFAHSWGAGVAYPRWSPHLAYGYGLPLWDFAPPLPYLIPLGLQLTGLSLEASLKAMVLLTALGYALGAYLFVRDNLGGKAGLVAAAVYLLAPFALREVLLYGGNYPQYLAIGLFPWVLWAIGRVYRHSHWFNMLLAAFLFGAVILTHLFHALVLAPVAAGYAVVLWLGHRHDEGQDPRPQRRLAAVAAGLGMGLLWTTFFWLPALIERKWTHAVEDAYISVSPFFLRFLNWHELLAWPQPLDTQAANPWVPFSLGIATLILSAMGLLGLLRHRRSGSLLAQGIFFVSLLALCMFMVLPASEPLWRDVPFLAVAEFPWRLLGLANLSLAFLAGASIGIFSPVSGEGVSQKPPSTRSPSAKEHLPTAVSLVAALAVLLGSAVYLYPFAPFAHYGDTLADMASFEMATRTIGSTTVGEYLPRWVETVPTTSPLAQALAQSTSEVDIARIKKLDRASLPEGATAQATEHTNISHGYRFDSPRPFQARFLTYYFPGWRAWVDGQPVSIVIEPGSGFITVPIPSGSHDVRLRFGDTPLRTASNLITGLAMGTMALIALWLGGSRVVSRTRRKRLFPPQTGREPPLTSHPAIAQTASAGIHRGWSWRSAGLVAGALLATFLIKQLVIDPHTTWFRRQSPAGQVVGVQHPLGVNLDDRFWLLGYDVDRDEVAQGGTLRVVLYWQAQHPAHTNYRSFVHLDAPTDQRTWAISDNFHPGDSTAQIDIPTSTWDTAHYVRDEHLLHIPPDVPPASFLLRAGLYDPETGERLPAAGDNQDDTVTLQTVRVKPGRGLRRADVPNPVDYRLDSHIRLLGYDWDAAADTLTLYWQSTEPLETDTVVFVHLLDEHDQLVWGADSPPLADLYPVSAWQPGLIVADPRLIAPGDLPPGDYTLAVGMYYPSSMTRLPVVDADGHRTKDNIIRLTRLGLP